MKHWREPGRGSAPSGRRHTVSLDDETTEEVRALAKADTVSFSEKIRQLVEWGLEAERSEGASARSQKR